jgi:2-phospho-L-lactate/phosphoenolpyruvate guanylyltransferase
MDAPRAAETACQHGYPHGVLAVVPVKGPDGAKTRLAPVLQPEERTRLVLDMLQRVLAACAEARAITGTLLVTPDPGFAPPGTEILRDEGKGHADAVALALRDERARSGVLVVMADCPLARAESLDKLAEAAAPLALAPSRDGGVNALALRPLDGFLPRFGVPMEETVATARAAGLEPAVVDDPLLALDVDRPEDYQAMLACL